MPKVVMFRQKGDFRRTSDFLKRVNRLNLDAILNQYGQEGVEALRAATPKDTGTTANSWSYNEYVQAGTQNTDDGLAALHELQNERYSFIGYAEAFADALNMSDDAKKVTMQLGIAIADNWKAISNGFNKAWGKVQESYPEIAQNLSAK